MAVQKRCRSCKQPKEGKRCRPCRLASYRRYRQRHGEELRRRARARREAGPTVPKQVWLRVRRWREKNPERHLEQKREQSRRRHERKRQARAAVDPAFRVKLEAKRQRSQLQTLP
jgi:hypothetical protein